MKTSKMLRFQRLLSPLKVTQRNVEWSLVGESVDWFQRERSSTAWLTNSSHEGEIFETDVGNPLEYEQPFCPVKEIVRREID